MTSFKITEDEYKRQIHENWKLRIVFISCKAKESLEEWLKIVRKRLKQQLGEASNMAKKLKTIVYSSLS